MGGLGVTKGEVEKRRPPKIRLSPMAQDPWKGIYSGASNLFFFCHLENKLLKTQNFLYQLRSPYPTVKLPQYSGFSSCISKRTLKPKSHICWRKRLAAGVKLLPGCSCAQNGLQLSWHNFPLANSMEASLPSHFHNEQRIHSQAHIAYVTLGIR